MKEVHISPSKLRSWKGFYDAFALAFNFPSHYARNLDSWMDCMHDAMEETTVLNLGDCRGLYKKKPEVIETLKELVNSLNESKAEQGLDAQLLLEMKL